VRARAPTEKRKNIRENEVGLILIKVRKGFIFFQTIKKLFVSREQHAQKQTLKRYVVL